MSVIIRLSLVLIAMIAFLTSMVVRHADHRANGFEITLAMEPIDPRDLMLGYYSIIRTDAHVLDMAELDGDRTGWREGQKAFVMLEEDGDGAWRPVAVVTDQPQGGVFLQGRVRSVFTQTDWRDIPDEEREDWQRRSEPIPGTERDPLRMAYNLEAYYAEAEQARALDQMRNENRLRLIVSLKPDGSAVIKGLEIDGERRIDQMFGPPRKT